MRRPASFCSIKRGGGTSAGSSKVHSRSSGALARPDIQDRLMLAYVIKRIVATIPVMAIVTLFVFSLLYIAPGDPVAIIAGDQATPADIERIRQNLGLDRPFLVRFGEWIWQIIHGDLGTSIFTKLPVATM